MTDREGPQSRHGGAGEQLFRQEREKLVRYADSRLLARGVPKSWADSQDVVQQASTNMLRRFRHIRSHRAYLYTCVEREIGREAREYAKGRRNVSSDADVQVQDTQAVQSLDDVECRHVIAGALSRLPSQQKKIAFLILNLGMTPAEAAEMLGIAPSTAAVHWHRARRTLISVLSGLCAALATLASWFTPSVREIIPAAGDTWPFRIPAAPDPVAIYIYSSSVFFVLLAFSALGVFGPQWKKEARQWFRELYDLRHSSIADALRALRFLLSTRGGTRLPTFSGLHALPDDPDEHAMRGQDSARNSASAASGNVGPVDDRA